MRIVGGKFKGRKLIAPEGSNTRPTSDRARESVFNILEHQPWGRRALRDGRVLDAFAGTGALGLEAFSRGTASVTFMDNDERAMKCLMQNAKGMADRNVLNLVRADVTQPPRAKEPCSLVFMDAPYAAGLTENALSSLINSGWIDSDTLCVVEVAKKDKWDVPAVFDELDRRKYGAAEVCFLKLGGS